MKIDSRKPFVAELQEVIDSLTGYPLPENLLRTDGTRCHLPARMLFRNVTVLDVSDGLATLEAKVPALHDIYSSEDGRYQYKIETDNLRLVG